MNAPVGLKRSAIIENVPEVLENSSSPLCAEVVDKYCVGTENAVYPPAGSEIAESCTAGPEVGCAATEMDMLVVPGFAIAMVVAKPLELLKGSRIRLTAAAAGAVPS